MSSGKSQLLNLQYPVFAAAWASSSSLVVGGGGGEGRNGVKNKISVIDCGDHETSVRGEALLLDSEDNVTSLDVGSHGFVYAGANQSSQSLRQGKNAHLRAFRIRKQPEQSEKDESEKGSSSVQPVAVDAVASQQVFTTHSVDDYQKFTHYSKDKHLLAIGSSSTPGTLTVLDTRRYSKNGKPTDKDEAYAGPFHTLYSKSLGSGSLNDLDFSPSGDRLAYASASKVFVLDAQTGEELLTIATPRKDGGFSKVRFVTDETVVVAFNLLQRKGALLYKFNALTGTRLASKQLGKRVRAISTMDAREKYVVVGTSDVCLAIYSAANLAELKRIEALHDVAITSVAINSNETRIASTSVAGTVHVLDVPAKGFFGGGFRSIAYAFYSVILIAVIAAGLQLLIKRQVLDDLMGLVPSARATSESVSSVDIPSTLSAIQETSVELEKPVETVSVPDIDVAMETEDEAPVADDELEPETAAEVPESKDTEEPEQHEVDAEETESEEPQPEEHVAEAETEETQPEEPLVELEAQVAEVEAVSQVEVEAGLQVTDDEDEEPYADALEHPEAHIAEVLDEVPLHDDL